MMFYKDRNIELSINVKHGMIGIIIINICYTQYSD